MKPSKHQRMDTCKCHHLGTDIIHSDKGRRVLKYLSFWPNTFPWLSWGFKISKGAKIRNRYNQVPHLTQDTNGNTQNTFHSVACHVYMGQQMGFWYLSRMAYPAMLKVYILVWAFIWIYTLWILLAKTLLSMYMRARAFVSRQCYKNLIPKC